MSLLDLAYAAIMSAFGAWGSISPAGLTPYQRKIAIALLWIGGVGVGRFLALTVGAHP